MNPIEGHSNLLTAIREDNVSALEKLITKDNVNHVHISINGRTTLPVLLLAGYYNSYKSAMFMIQLGANVNGTSETNSTALQLASYHARYDIVQLLLQSGAYPNLRISVRASALEIAMGIPNHESRQRLCLLLLDYGAELPFDIHQKHWLLGAYFKRETFKKQVAEICTCRKNGVDKNLLVLIAKHLWTMRSELLCTPAGY